MGLRSGTMRAMIRRLLRKLLHKTQETSLSAKIIRADGTVEDLGVISRTKSPGWETKGAAGG